MSYWQDRSRENLFAHSTEEDDFAAAVNEWKYTGAVTDYLSPIETCQLCEHPKLRYHYEIENRRTGARLLIGSECIKEFRFPVYDDNGNRLVGKALDEYLKADLKERQREMILEPLRNLYKQDRSHRVDIERCIHDFNQRKAFSPANLAHLFQLLEKHDILYPAELYPVTLRRYSDQQELNYLTHEEFALIRPALKPHQLDKYNPVHHDDSPTPKRAPPPTPQPVPLTHTVEPIPAAPSSTPVTFTLPGLPDVTFTYDSKVNKYTIAIYAPRGTILKYDFSGDPYQATRRLAELLKSYPPGSYGRVQDTLTGQIVKKSSR